MAISLFLLTRLYFWVPSVLHHNTQNHHTPIFYVVMEISIKTRCQQNVKGKKNRREIEMIVRRLPGDRRDGFAGCREVAAAAAGIVVVPLLTSSRRRPERGR